jgi:hypothetical protein
MWQYQQLAQPISAPPVVAAIPFVQEPFLEELPFEILGSFDAPPAPAFDFSPVKDCYIRDTAPTTNHDADNLKIGVGVNADGTIDRSLLHFDLSSIPSTLMIVEASLRLTSLNPEGGGTAAKVRRTSGSWNEDQVTWNKRATSPIDSAWDAPGGDFVAVDEVNWTLPSGTGEFIISGLAGMCEYARNVEGGDFYIILMNVDEATNNHNATFRDSEYSIIAQRPVLHVVVAAKVNKIPVASEPFMEALPEERLGSFDSPPTPVVVVTHPFLVQEDFAEELASEILGSFDVPLASPAVVTLLAVPETVTELEPSELLGSFDSPFLASVTVNRVPEASEPVTETPPNEVMDGSIAPFPKAEITKFPEANDSFVEEKQADILGSFNSPFAPSPAVVTLPTLHETVVELETAAVLGSFDAPFAASVVSNVIPFVQEPFHEAAVSDLLGSYDSPFATVANRAPEASEPITELRPSEVMDGSTVPFPPTPISKFPETNDSFVEEAKADILGTFDAPLRFIAVVNRLPEAIDSFAEQGPWVLLGSYDVAPFPAVPTAKSPETIEPFLSDLTPEILGSFDSPLRLIVVVNLVPTATEPGVEQALYETLGSFDSPLAVPVVGKFPESGEAFLHDVVPEILGSFNGPFAPPVVISLAWHVPSELKEELPTEAFEGSTQPFKETITVNRIPQPSEPLEPELTAGLMDSWFTPSPAPAIGAYGFYGHPFLYTAANWSNVTFVFEVYMRATVGTVNARAFNETDGTPLAGSDVSTASGSLVRLRSGAVTLIDGKEYRSQFALSAGASGETLSAELIAIPT